MAVKNEQKKESFWKVIYWTSFKVLLIYLALYIVGGIGYNIFCKEDINNRIYMMQSELNNITTVQQIEEKKVSVSQKFIFRRVTCVFKENKTAKTTFNDMIIGLKNAGWQIIQENGGKGEYYIKATKDKYVFTLFLNEKENNWYIGIYINDFIKQLVSPGSS